MKIRKIALRGAAVATAVLSVTALTAGSASAAPEQCEPGYFCMWENNAYTGRIYALRNADSPNFGDFFNDKMTSFALGGISRRGRRCIPIASRSTTKPEDGWR